MSLYGLTPSELSAVRDKIANQRKYLESETFVTDSGQVKTLLDVTNSPNHSARYFATVLNKVDTYVSYNLLQDLEPVFLTITLDGFFRDFLKGDYSRWTPETRQKYKTHIPNNDRFGRYLDLIDANIPLTSKDLYKILSYQWYRFLRSYTLQKIKRDNYKYTFIRVTEPHRDGVPHFHVLLYLPSQYISDVYFHFKTFFPAPRNHKIINRKDNGRIAAYLSKDVYETQGFQWKIGNVKGYLLKYLLKTFRNVVEDKPIDYLQAWYIHNRIPRITMSHTLIPQDVYFKAAVLDDDWFYLTTIRSEGIYRRNSQLKYFKFDDCQGRVIVHFNGYSELRNNGYLIKAYGNSKFPWSSQKPKDFLLLTYVPYQQRRRKRLKYRYQSSTYDLYLQFKEKNRLIPVEIDKSIYYITASNLTPRPIEYIKPVSRLTNLQLLEVYYSFDFDSYDLKRYGLIHNTLVKRGLIDKDYIKLDDFNTDFCVDWLREEDLNLRPSGYEPDELPGCSIPRPINPEVDGVEGLEPPNGRTKTCCLTTWRHPKLYKLIAYVGRIIIDFFLFVKSFSKKILNFFLFKIRSH